MSIEVLIFGCHGVILRHPARTTLEHWSGTLGMTADELEHELWAGDAWERACRGECSDAAYWDEVCDRLGVRPEERPVMSSELCASCQPNSEVLAHVGEARSRGLAAWILGNGSDATARLVGDEYGLRHRFDGILISAELGVVKPEEAAFAAGRQRVAKAASQILYIDHDAANIAAASQSGMHVAWFLGAAELSRQLAPHLGNGLNGKSGDGRDDDSESESAS